MAIPNVEDVDHVVVGKRYSVPVVIRKNAAKPLSVLPVIGPLHEDKEFIGFPARHWHPDRRFIPQSWFKQEFNNHWSVVLSPYPSQMAGQLGVGLRTAWQEPVVIDGGRRILTCKRLVTSFCERDGKPPRWLARMESAYKDEHLRNMICPHRGISCIGVKPEADGSVVCPGHGLAWNPKTGELVSRVGNDFRQKSLLG